MQAVAFESILDSDLPQQRDICLSHGPSMCLALHGELLILQKAPFLDNAGRWPESPKNKVGNSLLSLELGLKRDCSVAQAKQLNVVLHGLLKQDQRYVTQLESMQDQQVQLQTPSSPAALAPCGVSWDGCDILCSSGSIDCVRTGCECVELAHPSKGQRCCLGHHSTQQAAAIVCAAALLCTAAC